MSGWISGRSEGHTSSVILSEAKDLCTPGQLHRSFAAKDAAQDDKFCCPVSFYCVNSAGRPVSRSMRFAIGGWVENRLPKFIPRNG